MELTITSFSDGLFLIRFLIYSERVSCIRLGDTWYTLQQLSNMHLISSHLMFTGIKFLVFLLSALLILLNIIGTINNLPGCCIFCSGVQLTVGGLLATAMLPMDLS